MRFNVDSAIPEPRSILEKECSDIIVPLPFTMTRYDCRINRNNAMLILCESSPDSSASGSYNCLLSGSKSQPTPKNALRQTTSKKILIPSIAAKRNHDSGYLIPSIGSVGGRQIREYPIGTLTARPNGGVSFHGTQTDIPARPMK